MSQSRRGSLIEAGINVLIGYWISFAGNAVILPLFGFHVSFWQNAQIGILFTVISMARGYMVRRWFNSYITRIANGQPTSR